VHIRIATYAQMDLTRALKHAKGNGHKYFYKLQFAFLKNYHYTCDVKRISSVGLIFILFGVILGHNLAFHTHTHDHHDAIDASFESGFTSFRHSEETYPKSSTESEHHHRTSNDHEHDHEHFFGGLQFAFSQLIQDQIDDLSAKIISHTLKSHYAASLMETEQHITSQIFTPLILYSKRSDIVYWDKICLCGVGMRAPPIS
jgi:hypothetical protein